MSGNVIKATQPAVTKEEEEKLLIQFFNAIQPHLYYISKEMERRGIKSIAPWINSDGHVGLSLNGYNFYIRDDGTPILSKEEVIGVPFPDENI